MRSKRQLAFLTVLVVVLAAVLVYEWPRGDETAPGAAAPRPAARASRRAQPARTSAVPVVRLDQLSAARTQAEPPAAGRNLFQFQPKVAPPPPMPPPVARLGGPGGAGGAAGESAGPVVPPPPPIPFKFIGIVQAPDKKLAVLSDASTRDVFFGREGDVIDGRYRILRIGVESIEMVYLDGRGRQTIRLTGS